MSYRGFALISVLVISVVLGGIIYAFISLSASKAKFDRRLASSAETNKSLNLALFQLMDLSWCDSQLSIGDHSDPNGKYSWKVEAVTGSARLAKITVKQTLPAVTSSIVASGFKYHDF